MTHITIPRALLEQALAALEMQEPLRACVGEYAHWTRTASQTITALRAALAQPQAGPTGWAEEFRDSVLNQRGPMAENGMTGDQINDVLGLFDDLYTAAPPALMCAQAAETDMRPGECAMRMGWHTAPPALREGWVAWIVQATELNIDGTLTHQRDIDYLQCDIEDLPVGAQLYAAPPPLQGSGCHYRNHPRSQHD